MMEDECGCADKKLDPVEIHGKVSGTMRTNMEAADFGSYTTFSFTGTSADQPVRALSRDDRRSRAIIAVNTGSVTIGKKEGINSGVPGQGALWASTMVPLEIMNKQEVWVIGVTGAPSSISVVNERWDDGPTT
jgi:hypothetical protein